MTDSRPRDHSHSGDRIAQMPRKPRNTGTGATPPTVHDALAALDSLAPFSLAAEWDNVGLLAGRPEWPVTRALVAIDLTDAVAAEVLRKQADLLVVYHPPIFKGVRSITPDAACPTTRLPDLLAARVAIIAMHTALDSAAGGTNDVLLDAFDLADRYPLEPHIVENRAYKLVVFVPPAEVAELRTALSQAGAGVIGHYGECSYELAGRGTFRGDETTNPTVGQKLRLEYADETRLEMVVPKARLSDVVRTLYAHHSYEEPAFDLYPVHELPGRAGVGLGRVGVLKGRHRGTSLLRQLGRRVDLSRATIVGDLKRSFSRVTAAAGAFGVRGFCDPEALVLTGEFKHHDALELLKRRVTAVHLGHYASEQPMLPVLRSHLRQSLVGVKVDVARSDRDPFAVLR